MILKLDFPAMALKAVWIVSIAVLGSLTSIAQNASVDLSIDKTIVSTGDVIQLTVNLMNCNAKVEPLEIEGLRFIGGPFTSRSQSWINGVNSSEIGVTWQYLVASQSDIDIPRFTWDTNQGTFESDPIRITVTAASGKARPTPPSNQAISAVIVASKQTLYIGEPVVLTYKLISRSSNIEVGEINLPKLEGFWKKSVNAGPQRFEQELINGIRYFVVNMGEVVAFPQESGTFAIHGFDVKGWRRVNIFETQNFVAESEPVELNVLPLPEPIPPHSLGTFRSLRANHSLNGDTVAVNDAITYEIEIRGEGNIELIAEPSIDWPDGVEPFSPTLEDNISITAKGESGKLTFRYVLIPRKTGDFEIPAHSIHWFNALSANHEEIVLPELQFHSKDSGVQYGTTDGSAGYPPGSNQQVLRRELRHIILEPSPFHAIAEWNWTSWAIGASLCLSPMTFLVLALVRRKRQRETLDIRGTRKKKALKQLMNQIKDPHSCSPDQIGEAMEQFLMAKTECDRSLLTRERVFMHMQRTDEDLAKEWDALWTEIDMVRYGAQESKRVELAQRLLSLAKKTEIR